MPEQRDVTALLLDDLRQRSDALLQYICDGTDGLMTPLAIHRADADQVMHLIRAVPDLLDEITRLRQGLWDVATITGMDTDGDETPDHMVYPDIVDLAIREVTRLREDYDRG